MKSFEGIPTTTSPQPLWRAHEKIRRTADCFGVPTGSRGYSARKFNDDQADLRALIEGWRGMNSRRLRGRDPRPARATLSDDTEICIIRS